MTDRYAAGQLAMQARAQRAAGEAAHRHEGHDGYSPATSAAAAAQVRACVDAIGALDVVGEAGEVQQPDPRAVTFADEAIAATNSGPMTDAEVQADMVREVTIPPAQPPQPGGEEALVETVARALSDADDEFTGNDDTGWEYWSGYARAAIAAVRVHEPEPAITRWDDGSDLLLLGYAGGAHEDGSLAYLDTVLVQADGTERHMRFIRADRVGMQPAGDGLFEPVRPVTVRVHVPDVRAQALEEAARECDAKADGIRRVNTYRGKVSQPGQYGAEMADDCAKQIRALGAAPTPALAQEGWQDISTAPRDGQPILAWDPYYLMRCARPDPSSGSWLTDLPYGVERGEREMRIEPTHWMPLPAPPAGAAP